MSGQATPFQASPAPKDHPAGPPARTTSWFGALAIAGGVCFLVVAWIGATNPTFHGDLNSPIEYLNDAFGSAALALTIPGLLALRGVQGAPRAAVETAVTGQLLILIGVLAGLLLGEDLNCPGFDGGLGGWTYATSLDCGCSR
jgi:hypothetical protein